MGNFRKELYTYLKSGISLLQVATYEWQRLEGMVSHFVSENQEKYQDLYTWSHVLGIVKLDTSTKTKIEMNKEITDPLEALEWFHNHTATSMVMIMQDFHPFMKNDNAIIRMGREITRTSNNKSLIVQTLSFTDVSDWSKEVPFLEMDLPEKEILSTQLKTVVDTLPKNKRPKNKEEYLQIVTSSLGMTVMEAEIAYKKIIADKGQLTSKEIPMVVYEKGQLIKKSGILEYFHSDGSVGDIGGMNNAKDWLAKRGKAFTIKAKQFGLTPPKGVLLLGIPGCGKSLLAKTVANDWQLPLLKLDLGRIFGGIVGESEANMRKTLQLAEALSPAVLWIDEIEKGLSGMGSSGQTDGGTTSRVFGSLLTWMQDKTKPVFIVATANNIDMLPPELLRKGRFDEIFFVDLPNEKEREDIFKIHIGKKNRDAKEYDTKSFSKATIGFSGAEIEEVVSEALFISYDNNSDLSAESVLEAISKTYPLSKTMGGTIDQLRKWAKVRCRMASTDDNVEQLPVDVNKDIPVLKNEKSNPFS